MAMRGPKTVRSMLFLQQIVALSERYPAIDDAVTDFSTALEMEYRLPLFLVGETRDVYLHRLDYSPYGSAGLGLFIVTFHATKISPAPNTPYRTFTFLTIGERKPTPIVLN